MTDKKPDPRFRYIADIDPINIDSERVLTAMKIVVLGAIILGIISYFIKP